MKDSLQAIPTVSKMEITLQDVTELMSEIKQYHAIFSPFFARREHREHAELYLTGLLSPDLDRKSIEPMVVNLKGPDQNAVRAVQQFIGEGAWQDGLIRRRHLQEVEVSLGEEDGVVIFDGSDFPKQGRESAGVKRQYCGQLGKRANCQAGVFAGYTSSKGYTFLDARLYLFEVWFDQQFAARRAKCLVPEEVGFQKKNELAWEMLEAINQAGTLRFRWVTGDEAFGCDTQLLDRIASLGRWYFMEVPKNTRVWIQRPETVLPPWSGRGCKPKRLRVLDGQCLPKRVDVTADSLPAQQWSRHIIKEGSKGPIVADFAALRVSGVRDGLPGHEAWLVLRRDVITREVKYYLSNASAETELTTLVRISGMRWPIETCFEEGKQLLGMGDYEVRTWRGWHHHMTLCLLAHHFLVRLQQGLKKTPSDLAPGGPVVVRSPTEARGRCVDRAGCARLPGHP